MRVDPIDPVESAAVAGLRYITDDRPGLRRIRDAAVIQRIKSLVIPPGWVDVWICPDPLARGFARGHHVTADD